MILEGSCFTFLLIFLLIFFGFLIGSTNVFLFFEVQERRIYAASLHFNANVSKPIRRFITDVVKEASLLQNPECTTRVVVSNVV